MSFLSLLFISVACTYCALDNTLSISNALVISTYNCSEHHWLVDSFLFFLFPYATHSFCYWCRFFFECDLKACKASSFVHRSLLKERMVQAGVFSLYTHMDCHHLSAGDRDGRRRLPPAIIEEDEEEEEAEGRATYTTHWKHDSTSWGSLCLYPKRGTSRTIHSAQHVPYLNSVHSHK